MFINTNDYHFGWIRDTYMSLAVEKVMLKMASGDIHLSGSFPPRLVT